MDLMAYVVMMLVMLLLQMIMMCSTVARNQRRHSILNMHWGYTVYNWIRKLS